MKQKLSDYGINGDDNSKEYSNSKTAVEWLIEQLIPKDQYEGIMDIIKEAKEIEAEQIGYNKEEVDKLLDTLIQNNMCSVLGDELIEQLKKKQ